MNVGRRQNNETGALQGELFRLESRIRCHSVRRDAYLTFVTDSSSVTYMSQHEITCRVCGTNFVATRADARTCSPRCRQIASRRATQARYVSPPRWHGTIKQTRSVDLADALVEIANDGNRRTARGFYYVALSRGLIRPSMDMTKEGKASRDAAYAKITNLIVNLRKAGRISWNAVLDLTRNIDMPRAVFDSPSDARAALRRQYDEDRWIGQDFYPIFIVEKDALEPICKPMATQWQMPFVSSRGYGSVTLQHDVARLVKERRAAHPEQLTLVLFISDHDPSGLDLQRAWEDTLKDDYRLPIILHRIGLTLEQAEQFPEFALRIKGSDSRSKSYEAEHGSRAWEADIMPEEMIRAAIDDSINGVLDQEMWEQRDRDIERARSLL